MRVGNFGGCNIVSRIQTLTPRERESGKVLYIELSQRLVRGATNQIASLVFGGISDCERKINTRAQEYLVRSQSDTPPQTM